MSKYCLGLLMKYPWPGKVKTRLAKDLGPVKAALAYMRMADTIFRNVSQNGGSYEVEVFYSPETMRRGFEGWLGTRELTPQEGRDIGEIMCNALTCMFDSGATKAAVIGADIPGLSADIIKQAFLKLDDSDVVIGPAWDGGYYLIGMKSPHPDIFRDIRWSTEEVLRETAAVIERIGLRCETLEPLSDVDTLEDYLKSGI